MGYYLLQKNETFNDTTHIFYHVKGGLSSSHEWCFGNISLLNLDKISFHIKNDYTNEDISIPYDYIYWSYYDSPNTHYSWVYNPTPEPYRKIIIYISNDVIQSHFGFQPQEVSLGIYFDSFGYTYFLDSIEDRNSFNNFLAERGLKLKNQLTYPPQVFHDKNLQNNFLLFKEGVDLIVSNGLPLKQTDDVDIYTKNELNYSLFQHSETLIQKYYQIHFHSALGIDEYFYTPTLNADNEWIIHLSAETLYNMNDIEFVFETPFESDRDIQFFLERAYDQTKTTAEENIITQWFNVESGIEDINYRVASQAQGTALAIEPRMPVDKFEISVMGLPVQILKEDTIKYIFAYEIVDGIKTIWAISSENESLYDDIIYIQYGLFATESLYLWDNQGGRLITQPSEIKCRLTFALINVECGYCKVDELATMLGFTNIQIQDNKNNNYALDKEYYVEIYKTTSGKYNILPCYSDINPGNKLLLPQDYHFILYNIDEVTININDSNLSNLAPSPFKRIYNIETPLKLLLSYYYFETAFYNHKRQLSYDNILIEEKKDFFNILKKHGAQIENENKWQYDNNNHKWYGYEPLFVKWKDYEVFKIKDSTEQDFYSYKNMNDSLMIPHTTSEVINNIMLYYIDPKEIALCRYNINSYLFNSNNIKNQIQRDVFSYLLDNNKIEVGQLSLETDKQYLDLKEDEIYYDLNGKPFDTNTLKTCGYNYINIPRYKITEKSQEKYFKLLSIPANRHSTFNYNSQYFFNLNKEQLDNKDTKQNKIGLDYSEKEKNINAEYWTASPHIYPEIVFNNMTSKDDQQHILSITDNHLYIDDKVYYIYPNDSVVCYIRDSHLILVDRNFNSFSEAPWHVEGNLAYAINGFFQITDDTNTGSLKVPIDSFKLIPNRIYTFKGSPEVRFPHCQLNIPLFSTIIQTYKTTNSFTLNGYGFDMQEVFQQYGTYWNGISLGSPGKKAEFTLNIETEIDYLSDTSFINFHLWTTNIVHDFDYTDGNILTNTSWKGYINLTGELESSWYGVMHGATSFYGNEETWYSNENDTRTDYVWIDSRGDNVFSISKYIATDKFGVLAEHTSVAELTLGFYGPEPSSACAIVIWRNGKLNPQNPEYLNFCLTKRQNENSYGLTKYIGQQSIITIPKEYNNIPIAVIEKNSIPSFVKKLTCNHEVQIEDDAFLKRSSLETLELYNLPNDGLSRYFYDPNPNIGTTNLKQITIQQKATEIPHGCFANFSSLNIIDLSDSALTKINDGACIGCTSLKEIRFSPTELSYIGNGAFEDCEWLLSFDLFKAKNLKTIEKYAFKNCKQLKSLDLSNTQLTELKTHTFLRCGIQQIQLPNTLETICTKAFESCDLTEISIPRSVTKIEYEAFIMCNSLKKIWIPKEVKTIGYQIIMADYDYFPTIYCEAEEKPEGWDSDWIKGDYYKVEWNSSFEDYQNA